MKVDRKLPGFSGIESLRLLPRSEELRASEPVAAAALPGELVLRAAQPETLGTAAPPMAPPPRPSSHALASLDVAATRATTTDPRVQTMLQRVRLIRTLQQAVESARRSQVAG
ncbi:MAG: hypothetical protein AAGE52_40930 [Myxococcota bacterium]